MIQIKNNRDFVILTGEGGMRMFDTAIKKEFARQLLSDATSRGLVKPYEIVRLMEMIDSPDYGNCIVAITILEAKIELNGRNI